jgi:serine/threonine protein kinase
MAATAPGLPLGMRLDELEITGRCGKGGFSVVYTAWDHSLKRTVAVKEYMPNAIAISMPDGTVGPKSPKDEEVFRTGLTSFLNEARLLAQFTHPALVHIYRVWEQFGTAYIAMQYCMGKTLSQISQAEPAKVKDEGWLKVILTPILDALELLHAQNCFHRDISPDNILILEDGKPILLDFGAARQVIGGMTQGLTVVLKPGFAPVEQYADDPTQQGPWTDIYGVGAVLYYLLMGKPPVASIARMVKDPMAKLANSHDLTGVSHSFREAVDHALAVQPNQRIQSIAELRQALQLPTFKPDGQPTRVSAMPAEVRTVSEEIPLLGHPSPDRRSELLQQSTSEPREQTGSAPDIPIKIQRQVVSEEIPFLGYPRPDRRSEPLQLSTFELREQTGSAPNIPTEIHHQVVSEEIPFLEDPSPNRGVETLQTPSAFEPRGETSDTPSAPIEIFGTACQEKPALNSVKADDDLGASLSPASLQAPIPHQKMRIEMGASGLNAVAAMKIICRSSLFRNIFVSIGLAAIAFVVGWSISHRSVTVAHERQHIAASQTPIKDETKPPFSVVLPAQLPMSKLASAVEIPIKISDQASTSQEAISKAPIATVSSTVQEQSTVTTENILPIEKKATNVAVSSKAMITSIDKISADTAMASMIPASSPIIPFAASSSPTTSAKAVQQTSMPDEKKAMTAASESAPALSSKTSFVRLSIEPWGQVAVDGQLKGVSPPLIRLPLTPGQHVITITNGKFPVATVPVTVPEQGEAVVSYQFE